MLYQFLTYVRDVEDLLDADELDVNEFRDAWYEAHGFALAFDLTHTQVYRALFAV